MTFKNILALIMIKYISHIEEEIMRSVFWTFHILILATLLLAFNACSKTPEEKAIEGYLKGLFAGDLNEFVKYSSYGYALDSMGQRNLANLFVTAETARAKESGEYQKVKILALTHLPHNEDSMPTANAQVRIIFGTQTLETTLELVYANFDRWLINTMISLEPHILEQFQTMRDPVVH